MSSSIEEDIVERLRALDAEEQKRVLDFVEGIERQKSQPAKSLWDAIHAIMKDVPDDYGRGCRLMDPTSTIITCTVPRRNESNVHRHALFYCLD